MQSETPQICFWLARASRHCDDQKAMTLTSLGTLVQPHADSNNDAFFTVFRQLFSLIEAK